MNELEQLAEQLGLVKGQLPEKKDKVSADTRAAIAQGLVIHGYSIESIAKLMDRKISTIEGYLSRAYLEAASEKFLVEFLKGLADANQQ